MTSEAQSSTANLPTPSEAIRAAVASAHAGLAASTNEAAEVEIRLGNLWLSIARELREGATQPLIDRAMDRLTLHDVEGIVCSHGRVAIRRKNAAEGRWFLHTDDTSNCAEPMVETEHFRRRSLSELRFDEVHGPEGSAGTPTYGTVAEQQRPESLADTKVIERPLPAADPAADRIVDYVRGQILPPSLMAVRYAKSLRQAVVDGTHIPGSEDWSGETWQRMSSLVGEIITRHEQEGVSVPGDRPAEAALVRPYLADA